MAEETKTPAEKTEKKTETATGTKAPKQGREKNGRFASKSARKTAAKSDGKKESRRATKKEKGNENKETYILKCIEIPLDEAFASPIGSVWHGIFPPSAPTGDETWYSICYSSESEKKEDPNAAPSTETPAKESPAPQKEAEGGDNGTLEVAGKTYYSEKAVSQMISKTIAICASAAAKEVAKVKDEYSKDRPECPQACTPEADKQYEKSIRTSKVRRISQKIASVVANMMLGAFCVGLGSAAAFGLFQLGHLIFAK